MLFSKCYWGSSVKEDEMGGCMQYAYTVLLGKREKEMLIVVFWVVAPCNLVLLQT
jgi:hypothetical protein